MACFSLFSTSTRKTAMLCSCERSVVELPVAVGDDRLLVAELLLRHREGRLVRLDLRRGAAKVGVHGPELLLGRA